MGAQVELFAPPLPLAATWETSAARALERVLEPHAPATQRAYRAAWSRWHAHCAARGIEVAPIDAAELVSYLEAMGQAAAPNTVRLHLAALASLDAAARTTGAHPAPATLRSHTVVRRWLRSWSREHPRAPQKRAPALTVGEVRRVLAAAAEPVAGAPRAAHLVRAVRDRLMVLWGVTGAFRVSELCALELADVSVGARGLTLRVRRSKTDQHGESALVGLHAQGHVALCPVDAWLRWRQLLGDAREGPVLRAVERDGTLGGALSERQATRRCAELSARAGVPLVSAHSLRATFATLAAERGKSLLSIAEQGRWKSLEVVRGYVRQGSLFTDNASAGLLDET